MTIGNRIREARLARRWTVKDLFEKASSLPGAPELSLDAFERLEQRVRFRANDRHEVLGWACLALGIGPEEVGKAFFLVAA